MANNLTFNPTQLPSFARNRNKESSLSKALAGGGGGGGYPHRISIKGGVFRLIVEGKEVAAIEERYLDVVIVNAAPKVQRMFYAAKFDENENSKPSCWSSDGTKPDADVSAPVHNVCADCPNNVKGSGNGESKACRFQQRLALVLASDVQGNVLQLTVPSKSLFGKEEAGNFPLQAYARWLEAQQIEPNEVVTRIRFDTKEASPKLFFKTVRWLTDEEFAAVESKQNSASAKEAVMLMSSGSARVEVSGTPLLTSKAQPEEDASEPEEEAPKAKRKAKTKAEEADEPVVRKTAEAPTLPPSKAMASIVAEWDTDD